MMNRLSVDSYTIASNGCWIWKNCKRPDGYGLLHVNGKLYSAHRYSILGEEDNPLCVLHKCDNPSCVNPDHLFLGTRMDNHLDAVKKGRAKLLGWKNKNKTHCKRGHPLAGDNLRFDRGFRVCIECNRAGQVKRYQDKVANLKPQEVLVS